MSPIISGNVLPNEVKRCEWSIRVLVFAFARVGVRLPKPASARHSLLRFISPRLFIIFQLILYLKILTLLLFFSDLR